MERSNYPIDFRHTIWTPGTTFQFDTYVEQDGYKADYMTLRLLNTEDILVVIIVRDFVDRLVDSDSGLTLLDALPREGDNVTLPNEFTIVSSEPLMFEGNVMYPYESYKLYESLKNKVMSIDDYIRLHNSGLKPDNILEPRQLYTVKLKFN